MLPVEFWETACQSSSLTVVRQYQKGQSKDKYIILLFNSKYKRGWINMILLQDKHNIYSVLGAKAGKHRICPVFKPHSQKLYI